MSSKSNSKKTICNKCGSSVWSKKGVPNNHTCKHNIPCNFLKPYTITNCAACREEKIAAWNASIGRKYPRKTIKKWRKLLTLSNRQFKIEREKLKL